MARSKLTEQLDNITYEDLGIQFDEGLIWEKLDARLGAEPKVVPIRWMLAAAIFIGVLLLPITILKRDSEFSKINTISDNGIEQAEKPAFIEPKETIPVEISESKPSKPQSKLMNLSSRKVEMKVAAIAIPTFSKIQMNQAIEQNIKPQFAVEDISIIQASLENASINDRRKARTMSIRAQGQTSPNDEVNEPYQGLKIKLYEQKN